MIRIHADDTVPPYQTGLWSWNVNTDTLNFSSWKGSTLENDLYIETSGGYRFKACLNQIEEVIFRQEYARDQNCIDADVIMIIDIKNLILFLAPDRMMTKYFLTFIHTSTFDRFLNAIVIYFEYFLRLVEFILIRRDEVSGNNAMVESTESVQIKRIYSEYLSQHRLLLAREYSEILLGNGEMAPYYHMNVLVKMSRTSLDRRLYEDLLAFATQFVWVAHHRRAYDIIETEINRLFRSPHFKLNRKDAMHFTKAEKDLLFGKKNKTENCRRQVSPVIQAIAQVSKRDLPILWIGRKKYRGNDLRMQLLEIEYLTPASSLSLINIKHGILGNPKRTFNTMLAIDCEMVRKLFSKQYDPYQLLTQPSLEVPELDALRDMSAAHLEPYFEIEDNRFLGEKNLIKKWMNRKQVCDYILGGGLVLNVVEKCKREVRLYERDMTLATVSGVVKARRQLLRTRK